MNYLTAVHTDVGIRKKTNQDSALVMEATTDKGNVLLTVVCDGMGGLAKGEVASAAVIDAFSKWFENDLPKIVGSPDMKDMIFRSWEKIVFDMNRNISSFGKRTGISLGTTVVACLFAGNEYYIVNIGDSRAYCFSDRTYQLTQDQSYVQREIDMGRMTPEEAETCPKRNVLLQCIGASEYIEPAFYNGSMVSGQIFMLCSDGFRHVITDEEMYERLNPFVLNNEQQMKDNAVYLTELDKYRREQDNITVVLVRVE
jgi:serine/threonine protein phosphatase PrpC